MTAPSYGPREPSAWLAVAVFALYVVCLCLSDAVGASTGPAVTPDLSAILLQAAAVAATAGLLIGGYIGYFLATVHAEEDRAEAGISPERLRGGGAI